MGKTEEVLEKQNKFWVFIVGIALIIGGIYFFFDMKTTEEAGLPVRMKKAFQIVYDFGGKYAILAIFEILGLFALISGIQQLRNKL
ncbi:hypothetical protein [Tenacibaculum finnmarkense]|uniref:hypothetical protein n=1 Tax=Tenacibaculum finnmarkense TaxID=2781243 RepID=UPI00187B289F|nr:hypothetical protein [Tenacibaculum finnmarkense]MBE7659704.1 hypothetical protein [Tenacibaculum finnmarkense genomovar finnmarkense]MCG8250740.1 hypothetical protein [Tenacibaculum finnmarkense genomovar finnmarkense]MCG8814564.1 hypothetical protein [Tenacibaculum finnmarkense]MCG8819583.1 hypothetical protein [Tenacibaculum finnmarkense]MCG8892720.1 hypothetical protein [Tenacibaculum finnmarkense]